MTHSLKEEYEDEHMPDREQMFDDTLELKYTPPASKVDLAKKPMVLKAVMAQISRPEYLAKIPRYTEDSGPEDGDELCRFPPVDWQQRSIDVKARDKNCGG